MMRNMIRSEGDVEKMVALLERLIAEYDKTLSVQPANIREARKWREDITSREFALDRLAMLKWVLGEPLVSRSE